MRSGSCASLDAIARYAESAPQSPALIDPNGVTLSYERLWAQILAVGRRLEESGIGFDDTVAVLLPQGVVQVLATAGVLDHCVCAPMHPRTTVAETQRFLGALRAEAMIVSPEFEAEAEAASMMGLTVLVARPGQHPDEWQIRRSCCSDTIPCPTPLIRSCC